MRTNYRDSAHCPYQPTWCSIAWGALGVYVVVNGSPLSQLFMAAIMVGMSAIAIPLVAAASSAYLAFVIPMLLPMTIAFLTLGEDIYTGVGFLLAACLIVQPIVARNVQYAKIAAQSLRESEARAKAIAGDLQRSPSIAILFLPDKLRVRSASHEHRSENRDLVDALS